MSRHRVPPRKPPGRPWLRKLAVLYGFAMVNIAAFILYDKLSAPQLVFDKTFKAGIVCLLLGVCAFLFAHLQRDSS